MIESIRFKSGYPLRIPTVADKAFIFKPGINILFGTNGCGKSTILHTLKAYCGIAGGGWTYFNDPMRLASSQFPFAYLGLTPSRSEAYVNWDGTPSFFNDGDIKVDNTFFYMSSRSSDDGITSEAEQMDTLARKPSSGQYRIKKVNQVFNMVRNVPVFSATDIPHGYNQRDAMKELAYWNSLSKTGPQTILLDEPERALSLPLQRTLFFEILPQFKDLQLIIATHSIFCLKMPDANIIEFDANYVEQCKHVLSL